MKMCSTRDIRSIIELFLAQHFNFAFVNLNEESVERLEEICESYSIEVENIFSND